MTGCAPAIAPTLPPVARPVCPWQLRSRTLETGARTLIMGIVNITPDSFSGDGAEARSPREAHAYAVEHGLGLLEEGATILDLGGESTRPGSGAASAAAISTTEEQDRLLPVIEALLRESPQAILSADTYRAATARAAFAAGAEIVNDVSGFLWDSQMAETCGELPGGLVLMHTRGRPDEWRALPPVTPGDVLALVLNGLHGCLKTADGAGIARERIVLDPGYGFGKAFDVNYALLRQQAALLALGRPLLAGVSRKSFLGRTLGQLQQQGSGLARPDVPPSGRDNATIAASVAAILQGASLLRVHAVRPAIEAAAIADAVLSGGIAD